MGQGNPSMGWDQFRKLKASQKALHLQAGKDRFSSFLYAQQIDRPKLEFLIDLAEYVRGRRDDIDSSRYIRTLLNTRSCALYFPQCSTRTFTSFSLAAQSVGMMVEEIRDTQISAMYKGESELDTLITLATVFDFLIIRQMDAELTERIAFECLQRGLETRIINAGSGAEQHPTQSILDMYTLAAHTHLREDADISVAFVGDLKRSRTARSLAYLLALYPSVTQVFVAPEELQLSLIHISEPTRH